MKKLLLFLSLVTSCISFDLPTSPKATIAGDYVLRTLAGQNVPNQTVYAGLVRLSDNHVMMQVLSYPYMGYTLTDTVFADYFERGDSVIVYFPQQRAFFLKSGKSLITYWNLGLAVFTHE